MRIMVSFSRVPLSPKENLIKLCFTRVSFMSEVPNILKIPKKHIESDSDEQ